MNAITVTPAKEETSLGKKKLRKRRNGPSVYVARGAA